MLVERCGRLHTVHPFALSLDDLCVVTLFRQAVESIGPTSSCSLRFAGKGAEQPMSSFLLTEPGALEAVLRPSTIRFSEVN